MNRPMCIALVAALVGGPFLAGCEDTVSKTETTKVKDDGTVVKKEQKVTENPDGSVTKTERKSVDKPDNDGDGASIKIDVDKKD